MRLFTIQRNRRGARARGAVQPAWRQAAELACQQCGPRQRALRLALATGALRVRIAMAGTGAARLAARALL